LLLARFGIATATLAGGLNSEMQWSRSPPVGLPRARSGFEKQTHGRGAARSNGAMQRRDATPIGGVLIGSRREQALEGRTPRGGVPAPRPRVAIAGVVQWFGASAILGSLRSATCHEISRDTHLIGGGGEMKRRVASVDVVLDPLEEEGRGGG